MFDGLQSEPSGVEPLLAEADVAMTKGEPNRAVRLLETAFERDSTHVGVRVELANALFAAQDVGILSVRAAVEQVNGTGSAGNDAAPTANCTGERALADRSGSFARVSLRESTPLGRLAGSADLFARASRLVVDGVLQRRADALGAAPTSRQLKAYFLAALTRMGQRLRAVYTELRDTEATLYVAADGASSPAVVACGETRTARAAVERALCRLEQGTRQATSWLRIRNERTGSEQTNLLISRLESHAAALGPRPICESASRPSSPMLRSQSRPVE